MINRIIVDKLPEGCADCQLYRDNKCYGLIREDYDAKTEFNFDYRRSDCPMIEESKSKIEETPFEEQPIIINNECNIPPCNSCCIYNCIYHITNRGKEE